MRPALATVIKMPCREQVALVVVGFALSHLLDVIADGIERKACAYWRLLVIQDESADLVTRDVNNNC